MTFKRSRVDPARLLKALAFAADKHRDQRRKDAGASPYINHCIAVATVLALEGGVTDQELLIAAILHDAVEDTRTTFAELQECFATSVASLVRELTDDKSLPKAERKRLQIENAASLSPRAKLLKIADKICNVRDIRDCPPSDWSIERRREYLTWAEQVIAGCRGVNGQLDRAFDVAVEQARALLTLKASCSMDCQFDYPKDE